MSTSVLDKPTQENHTSSASESGAMNVIDLASHPLWQQREYDRLISFLDGKPDSGWYKIFNLHEGEDHVERGKEWQRSMIESGVFTPEHILYQAKKLAPWTLFLERMEEKRKNPPDISWLFKTSTRKK